MKSFTCFIYLNYPWIKKVVLYDCTFEICFVYERKCGDMMFWELILHIVNSTIPIK